MTNSPNHISEKFETIFCVKILKFFDADPESDGKIRIRVKHPWSATPDFLLHNIVDKVFFISLTRVTGGMKVKADRDEASPYAAMLAAQDVAEKVKVSRVRYLHRFLHICLVTT